MNHIWQKREQISGHTFARPYPLSVMIDGIAISVLSAMSACKSDWTDLEKNGDGSYYQSFRWCQAWLKTIGAQSNIRPIIVIGKSAEGVMLFVLPFQIRRRFGFNILEWLTQPESNYGQGLISKAWDSHNWFDKNLADVLSRLPNYDLTVLINMPDHAFGAANPLSSLNRFKSADQSFFTKLRPSFEELHDAKRTSRSISKIRRRDERLEELGKLDTQIITTGPYFTTALTETLEHKSVQLAELGVHGFDTKNLNAFFGNLGGTTNQQITNLHIFRLRQSDRTISALVGASYANTFWLIILSMSPDGPLQFSPGDYILRKSIAWACENNLQFYDFGMGQSHYKEIWADHETQLYNYFAAKTLKGLPLAAIFMFYNAAKRLTKNTPVLKSLFFQLRKWWAGKRAK